MQAGALRNARHGWPGPGPGRTDVRSGLLFVWHDQRGNPPQPEVRIPEIPSSPAATGRLAVNSILIEGSNCRDIIDKRHRHGPLLFTSTSVSDVLQACLRGSRRSQYLTTSAGRTSTMRPHHTVRRTGLEASYFGPSFLIKLVAQQVRRLQGPNRSDQCHTGDPGLFVPAVGCHRREHKGLLDAGDDREDCQSLPPRRPKHTKTRAACRSREWRNRTARQPCW